MGRIELGCYIFQLRIVALDNKEVYNTIVTMLRRLEFNICHSFVTKMLNCVKNFKNKNEIVEDNVFIKTHFL